MNRKSEFKLWQRIKIVPLILASFLCIAAMGTLSGCSFGNTDTPPVTYEPPAKNPEVRSLTITYNGETVVGMLSTDISRAELSLSATVQKDEGASGTLTFSSSLPEVATIDNNGKVELLSVGETVITASFGGVNSSIVLVVTNMNTGRYSITVNGGKADVSGAMEGDIVTMTPHIPAHKEFVDWSFAESETAVTWISGNSFKMPAGDVYVVAQFTDMLYTLQLVGAKVTSDGSENVATGTVVGYEGDRLPEYAITEYKYAYDTPLTISAADTPDGMMFVGWDYNTVNNRLEEEEVISGITMPDETTTYWANFSPINSTKILTATPSFRTWTSSLIDDVEELEGLSGISVTIPAGQAAMTGYNEAIQGSVFSTVSKPSQAVRVLFRNRGAQPVSIEIYASDNGNRATTGVVTVPAGETVSKTFIALLGINNPWWGISVRESLNSADGAVPLDIVLGCADAYPKGDKTLAVTAGTQLVKGSGFTFHQGKMNMYMDNSKGWVRAAQFQHSTNYINLPVVASTRLTNLPTYNSDDPYITLYMRMTHQTQGHDYHYTFTFGTDAVPVDEDGNLKSGTKKIDVTVSYYGETKLFAIRLPRTGTENYYFGVIKNYDTEDGTPPTGAQQMAVNFSMVLTYNNGIGFTGEVVE